MAEIVVQVPAGPDRVTMLGSGDRNLKIIREALGVRIAARDRTVRLSGTKAAVHAAREVLSQLHAAAEGDVATSRQEVLDMIGRASRAIDDPDAGPEPSLDAESSEADPPHTLAHRPRPTPQPHSPSPWRARRWDASGLPADRLDLRPHSTNPRRSFPEPNSWSGALQVYAAGMPVAARTRNQEAYLEAIRTHDMVFGIGPAGTGKTYLAVASAVHMLRAGLVNKVILVRPAVEAGEKLGFLPGDLHAKVNPYLRPLFDALHDMMDYPTLSRFVMSDVVEVAPLAYMRGRTLNRAVIILDEAQNTTRTQMKMFLTRMGQGSKAIVTGDTTQIDLPDPTQSGLVDAARRLARVPGLAFVTLDRSDIVRHALVQRIVEAYGESDPDPSPLPDRPHHAPPPSRPPAENH